jgi:carbon storage regulator
MERRCAMLVLSRKTGESLFIGSDVSITVVEVKGNRVKFGIHAPQEVPVWRAELAHPELRCEEAQFAEEILVNDS